MVTWMHYVYVAVVGECSEVVIGTPTTLNLVNIIAFDW